MFGTGELSNQSYIYSQFMKVKLLIVSLTLPVIESVSAEAVMLAKYAILWGYCMLETILNFRCNVPNLFTSTNLGQNGGIWDKTKSQFVESGVNLQIPLSGSWG